MGIRTLLYTLARLLGDANAVRRNRVPERIGRRVTGRLIGRHILSKLF